MKDYSLLLSQRAQDLKPSGIRKFFDMLGGKKGIAPDYLVCIDRDECIKLFAEYASDENAENY